MGKKEQKRGGGKEDCKDEDECSIDDVHPGDHCCSLCRPSGPLRLLYILRIEKYFVPPNIRSLQIDKADRVPYSEYEMHR